jgi:hypothetical protein
MISDLRFFLSICATNKQQAHFYPFFSLVRLVQIQFDIQRFCLIRLSGNLLPLAATNTLFCH